MKSRVCDLSVARGYVPGGGPSANHCRLMKCLPGQPMREESEARAPMYLKDVRVVISTNNH